MNSVCLKYEIQNNSWLELAPYPIQKNGHCFLSRLSENIVICGYESPRILCYNISTNTFIDLPIVLSENTRKINFCYSNRIYILEDAKSIHESGMNDLNKWTNIGSCSNLNNIHIASNSVLYK